MLALLPPTGQLAVDKNIVKLQEFVARQPEKADGWLALGSAWIRKARDDAKPSLYANANACTDIALRLQPENRLASELKGLVLMNDHRFEEARKLMQSLVEASPDHPVAWGTLSDAQLELGRSKEAVESAQRMMDLKPNLPSYSRAAHLQWLHGDLAGAKQSLRYAVDAGQDGKDKEPKAWVLVQAAMMFWNEGDYDGAMAGFDSALKDLPDFPPALVGKARVLLGQGDARQAAPLLATAYKANPLVETGWLLGDAREAAGDLAGAAQARAEIEKRGKLADPRTLSLYYTAHDREPDLALQLAQEEIKSRDDQYTEDALAWALYRKGRLDDALVATDKTAALGTRDARLWFHQGAIHLAKGDAAKGRALLTAALKLNPHFDVQGEAEARRLLASGSGKTAAAH